MIQEEKIDQKINNWNTDGSFPVSYFRFCAVRRIFCFIRMIVYFLCILSCFKADNLIQSSKL